MSFERTTPCGVISGTACQWPGIAAYKGIRYATAGRWEFPVPVTHWDGVYDATQYGACCYQPRAFYDEAAAPGKAFYYNEFRKGETGALYLGKVTVCKNAVSIKPPRYGY